MNDVGEFTGTGPPPPRRGWAASLRAYARGPALQARCELCSAALADAHPHLADLTDRRLLCSCRRCALLFGRGDDRRASGGCRPGPAVARLRARRCRLGRPGAAGRPGLLRRQQRARPRRRALPEPGRSDSNSAARPGRLAAAGNDQPGAGRRCSPMSRRCWCASATTAGASATGRRSTAATSWSASCGRPARGFGGSGLRRELDAFFGQSPDDGATRHRAVTGA